MESSFGVNNNELIDGEELRRRLLDLVYPDRIMLNVQVDNKINDIVEDVKQACGQSYQLGWLDCPHAREGEGGG